MVTEFSIAQVSRHISVLAKRRSIVSKRSGFKARRRFVERVHSWMNRFRRILVRWEKKSSNCLAMVHFVCGIVALSAAVLI